MDKKFILIDEESINQLNEKMDQILVQLANGQNNDLASLGKWIPESKVKKLLDLSTTTLWKLRKSGQLEFSKPNNSTVYYSKESIMQWLDDSCRKPFTKDDK